MNLQNRDRRFSHVHKARRVSTGPKFSVLNLPIAYVRPKPSLTTGLHRRPILHTHTSASIYPLIAAMPKVTRKSTDSANTSTSESQVSDTYDGALTAPR